jgi:hypothetical protein
MRTHLRMQKRNKQLFYFAAYLGKREILDESGNKTGEWEIHYEEPAAAMGSISAARGDAGPESFGISEEYQKVLQVENPRHRIGEDTALWIDCLDTRKPHDYVVKGVARGLESARYALARKETA